MQPNDETPGTPQPESNPYPPPPPPLFNDQAEAAAGPPPPPSPEPPVRNKKDEQTWAMFAHLSVPVAGFLGGLITSTSILCFVGPLIIYLMKKDESEFVADQAKEALNFSITMLLITIPLSLLAWLFIIMVITAPLALLLVGVLIIIGLLALVATIMAAIKANEGVRFRYPFILRFIK